MQKFSQEQLNIAFRNAVPTKVDLPTNVIDGTIALVKEDFKLYGYKADTDTREVVAGGGGGGLIPPDLLDRLLMEPG